MNRIKGHLRYYLMNSKSDLVFAWSTMGIILVIILFSVFTKNEPIKATGYVRSFFTIFSFYFLGIGVNNVFETFPYIMSFSSTRREFYLGLLSKYLLIAGTFSGLIVVFYVLEIFLYQILHLPHVGYLELWGRDVSGIAIFFFIFVFYMFLLALYNVLSLIMIRFRLKQFFFISAMLGGLVSLLSMVFPVLQKVFVHVFVQLCDLYLHYPLWPLILWLSLATLLILGIGWLFVRKAEVKVLNTAA